MYKKTSGPFQHDGTLYEKGHVFTEDEVKSLGIDESSLVDASENEHTVQAAKAAPAADKDAELDTEQPHGPADAPLPSAPAAGDADTTTSGDADTSAAANGGDAGKTLPHEVSQADLDANEQLVKDGVKVGDVIQIPAIEKEVDADWLAAHEGETKPDGSPFVLGDKILVAE